jgi:hypothetical protein
VLKKGKDTFEHIIETKYDEKSITTIAERKEQEQFTETLYNMVEDLAYMVYELTEIQKSTQEVIEKDTKGKKQAEKLFNELESLRKDLVITTGDNYVASAENELREKMGELYSNVATSYDRVSGAHKLNFELISEEFKIAENRFKTIMSKEGKKYYAYLEKANVPKPQIQSKTKFLSKG